MNEVLETLKARRSVRLFKSDLPTDDELKAIVEAGLYAPSGRNMQEVITIVVKNKELRDEIAEVNRQIGGWKEGFDPFYQAPVIIIVLGNKERPTHVYDGSVALENMMLAATSLGLGSCWIHRAKEEFERPRFKQLLKDLHIEGNWEGIGHLAIGYPAKDNNDVPKRKEGRVYTID